MSRRQVPELPVPGSKMVIQFIHESYKRVGDPFVMINYATLKGESHQDLLLKSHTATF